MYLSRKLHFGQFYHSGCNLQVHKIYLFLVYLRYLFLFVLRMDSDKVTSLKHFRSTFIFPITKSSHNQILSSTFKLQKCTHKKCKKKKKKYFSFN